MVRRKNTLPKGSFLHRRSRIHTDFSHIAHKRRNTRFNGLWRVHTPPQPLNAHTAAHRANGAGKRGAALRGAFESTKICAKRFQIRDGEKPREQNNSRQTAAARQGRVDAVRRRRGSADPRSLGARCSACAGISHSSVIVMSALCSDSMSAACSCVCVRSRYRSRTEEQS